MVIVNSDGAITTLAMITDDWIRLGASMLPGLAGVVVAVWALSKWRRELEGKTEFDLARRTLLAVYKVRDAIAYIRNELGPTDQGDRLRVLSQAKSEFDLCVLEAKIAWGDILEEPNEGLRGVQKAVVLAVRRLQRAEKDNACRKGLSESGKFTAADAAAWGDEDDEVGQKLSAAVQLFEDALSPHLSKKWRRWVAKRDRNH